MTEQTNRQSCLLYETKTSVASYALKRHQKFLWPLGDRTFISNLTSDWPWVTPAWPWPEQCITLWSGAFWPNLVAIGYSLSTWPLVDSGWPLYDLWPQKCVMLYSGLLLTKFGGNGLFLKSNLISSWPRMTPAWSWTLLMCSDLLRDSADQIWWP